jgi:hypothetical protein
MLLSLQVSLAAAIFPQAPPTANKQKSAKACVAVQRRVEVSALVNAEAGDDPVPLCLSRPSPASAGADDFMTD